MDCESRASPLIIWAVVSLAVFLFGAGCEGGGTVMEIEGYDLRCARDEECVGVFVGDVCGCNCEAEAIGSHEQERWNAEWEEKLGSCESVLDCAPCPDIEVVCNTWRCNVRE